MTSGELYAFFADVMLIVHALFVVFVVLGLILIFAGRFMLWHWVRNPWFRIAHLLSIATVVLQSWLGVSCPLTIWEIALRSKAGQTIYQGSFITHWLNELLYYEAPSWVFLVCYTLFGGLALCSWYIVRPRAFSDKGHTGTS